MKVNDNYGGFVLSRNVKKWITYCVYLQRKISTVTIKWMDHLF